MQTSHKDGFQQSTTASEQEVLVARIKELEDEIVRWRNTHATQRETSLTYCSWLNEVADALGVTCGNMHAIRRGLAAQQALINALEAKINSMPATSAVLLQNLYVVNVPLTQNLQNPANERGSQ